MFSFEKLGAEQPPHKKSHPAGQKLQKKIILGRTREEMNETVGLKVAVFYLLELCLARYLSLHFFFFPNGLQDWVPSLALLLLATLLQGKQVFKLAWEYLVQFTLYYKSATTLNQQT